jgi:hypothetical protein
MIKYCRVVVATADCPEDPDFTPGVPRVVSVQPGTLIDRFMGFCKKVLGKPVFCKFQDRTSTTFVIEIPRQQSQDLARYIYGMDPENCEEIDYLMTCPQVASEVPSV